MNETFTLELPKNVAPQQLSDLEKEMAGMSGVDDAGTLDSRSIDPATIGLWVQAATGILGMLTTAVPFIEKIMNMVRRRGIKGAKLRFQGGEIELDTVSADDLKKVLAAINATGNAQ